LKTLLTKSEKEKLALAKKLKAMIFENEMLKNNFSQMHGDLGFLDF
jgi:hypothetical protein